MTQDDNIERVLERWFTEGPRHMPDRLFDGTLERIERLPKRRLADLPMRLSAMNRNARLAAAAALIVALAGAGLVVLNGVPGVGTRSSPTPPTSTAPRATTLSASVMGSLEGRWTSIGLRPIPGSRLDAPIDFTISPGVISMNGFKGEVASSMVPQGDGSLLLELTESQASLTGQHWTCTTGDQSQYRIDIAADGDTLDLASMSDACSTRAGILAGQWTRWPCALTDEWCTADLAPGRHVAVNLKPFARNAPAGRTVFGSLSYEIPAGWAVPYVPPTWPDEASFSVFRLQRAGDGPAPIVVFADAHPSAVRSIPNSSPPACSDDSGGAGQTPQSIGSWLASVQGAVATAPVPITIGGMAGVDVDLSLAPGFSIKCGSFSQEGDPPSSPSYTDEQVTTFASQGGVATLEADAKSRYVILDAGDGAMLLIQLTTNSAGFDALVADAMPIIQTFEFTR